MLFQLLPAVVGRHTEFTSEMLTDSVMERVDLDLPTEQLVEQVLQQELRMCLQVDRDAGKAGNVITKHINCCYFSLPACFL